MGEEIADIDRTLSAWSQVRQDERLGQGLGTILRARNMVALELHRHATVNAV